jgi:hypothetical protein
MPTYPTSEGDRYRNHTFFLFGLLLRDAGLQIIVSAPPRKTFPLTESVIFSI